MVITAATKLGVSENEVRDIVNLSFATSGVEGILDKLCPVLEIHQGACPNNQMVDVINNVKAEDMVA